MTQPLKMAMLATLDSSGVKAGASDAKSALATISAEAKKAETSLQAAINAQLGIGRPANSNRATDVQKYGSALDDLRAKYNPLFAAQRKYKAELDDIRRAQKLGAISASEAAAALQRTKAGFAAYTVGLRQSQAGLNAHSASTKLATHELTNLSYQSIDITQQLLSGQSFAMIMAQQSGQVAQILGKRGLGTIIPALASSFASLITPTTLLLAGITAGGYAAYGIYRQFRGEVVTVDEALENLDETLERLEAGYESAAEAARGFIEQASFGSVPETLADLRTRQAELQGLFERETAGLFQTGVLRTALQVGRDIDQNLTDEFRKLVYEVATGEITVNKFGEAIAEIRLRDDLPKPAKKLADDLLIATRQARKLEGSLLAIAEAAAVLSRQDPRANGRVGDAFGLFEQKDALEKLRSDLERLAREAAGPKIPVPGKKPVTIDLGSEARDFLKTQDEQLTKLRLEMSLIGASDAVRRRALATLEAELEIRNAGIDAQSREADRIRENAAAIAEMNSELDRSAEAWETVQSTGERSIDTLVDKLSTGDIEGAITSIAGDLSKQLLTLGAANPLKNAVYNSGLPTFGDTGGVSGFFKSLLGGGPLATGSMQVQAATVLVNGEPLSAFGAFNNIANDNPAFNLAAGNSNANSGSVAGQIWNYFKGKGLKDHQAAAILGHVSAESSFNPFAIGDGGNAFGLFQHNDRRFNLFDAIGGRKNLGNVQGQLNFVWQELMTTESRAMKALLGSSDLRGATAAFGGFERPAGFSWNNPEGMHNWTGRLAAAEDALNTFGGGLTNTTSGLTRLDGGLGSAVSALANGSGSLANTATAFAGQSESLAGSLSNGLQTVFNGLGEGGSGGGLGGFLSSLISPITSLFGFQSGGGTGPGADSDVKGYVHANEFVFSAPATRRIGVKTLEALHRGSLKGYQEGGFVTSHASPAFAPAANSNAAGAAPTSIAIHNYSGAQVDVQEERTERGGRNIRFVISEQISDGITTPGGAAQRTLKKNYGMRKRRTRR
ncbi:MAG: phage tail length tape measure family protein [Roseibium sp.]|uniref:phage tail tip lysozyme n=1 Tax=Roseibium sp. TaxID=1936156 RepID=UPI00262E7379|nr:phage tail tip lysozyme [Roseibium sp.]MCV0424671.1 phage tail length tape measure family protein [Roseibium sp.]